jgi:outer membrane lipoprotein carrier protein
MKKGILLLTALAASLTIFSQNPQTESEKKGNDLVKTASDKIRSYKSLKIDFIYEMDNKEMDIKESMSGVVFSEGKKYYMEVGDNIFISDGTTIWNYVDDLEEVQISNAGDAEGGLTPTQILNDFEEHFKATFIKQEMHKGKKVDIVDLVPKVSQAFFKYRVALDSKDQMIVYSIAYDRHGGTYTYNLNTVQINPTIPAGKFSFDKNKFPNAYINDLR